MIRKVTETREVTRHCCDWCGRELPDGTEGRVVVTVALYDAHRLTAFVTDRRECPGEWCRDCARMLMIRLSDMAVGYTVALPERVGKYPQDCQPDPEPGCDVWDDALDGCKGLLRGD